MWVAHPRGMGLHYITPLPLLPTFWLLLYIFSYRKYFPVFLINSFSVNSYNVGSPMREGELRVFLLHHLAVFLWWLVMFSIFSCACWPSVCLLWKNAYYFLIELFGFDIDLLLQFTLSSLNLPAFMPPSLKIGALAFFLKESEIYLTAMSPSNIGKHLLPFLHLFYLVSRHLEFLRTTVKYFLVPVDQFCSNINNDIPGIFKWNNLVTL